MIILLGGTGHIGSALWDMSLETARSEGCVQTLLPADLRIPMVAPDDIALLAARLLTETTQEASLYYLEGPERYSARDVAAAFSGALGKSVTLDCVPPAKWTDALQGFGFSPSAAASMAAMTRITVEEAYEAPEGPLRGATTLHAYIEALVAG